MSTLERALAIALYAHRGQKDRTGEPYILHPLQVMMQMDDEQERIAAILHDVVEDSALTLHDLQQEGFSADVLEAVALLTHDKEALGYEEYVRRIRPNPLARKIKLADLRHNMDLRRLAEVTDADLERLRKYHRAWEILTE